MQRIIAGLYEINEPIGSGGGGVVFIGRHIRLNKTIVLKADKRRLTTNLEKLRREVDLLKNLSHSYIPQVYDFVQEGGVVFTVMDYIEGESLQDVLKSKREISQPEIIKWACQLLDALEYLHSRPPYGILHGDIKPANIMLRPNGDICLIDYNIALALGEKGAVKVGYSRGYASPEHYTSVFYETLGEGSSEANDSAGNSQGELTEAEKGDERTVAIGNRTELLTENAAAVKKNPTDSRDIFGFSGSSSVTSKKTVLLDARSDIYSLAATLYHLLSGKRPEEKVEDVSPLGEEHCNPEISEIIAKAMAPDPDKRYQSASEMKKAFLELYHTDRRSRAYKRRAVCAAVGLGISFLAGGALTLVGSRQMEQIQRARVLSEQSQNALEAGDVSAALKSAMEALPRKGNILHGEVTAEARYALTEALGVYHLEDGFEMRDVVSLPAAPFSIVTSPNEELLAVLYGFELSIIDLKTLHTLKKLDITESAYAEAVFTDDSHILYSAPSGIAYYDIAQDREIWKGEPATDIALSGDGRYAAGVYRREKSAVLYRVETGEQLNTIDFMGKSMDVPVNDLFADPDNRIFALNDGGNILAVSFDDGSLYLFSAETGDASMVYEASGYSVFNGGFYKGYFACSASNSLESVFGLVNTETDTLDVSFTSEDAIRIKTDEGGIYICNQDLLVQYDPGNGEQTDLAYTNKNFIYNFDVSGNFSCVNTTDNTVILFDRGGRESARFGLNENFDYIKCSGDSLILASRDAPSLRIIKRESHRDKELISYDPAYSHDEARVSADGQHIMLFSIDGFRIYDNESNLVSEVSLPDRDNMYDQQYRRMDGASYLEVKWYDGIVRKYDGADGSLLTEEQGALPSKVLEEEFLTDNYKIIAAPHEAPQVFDLNSQKFVNELNTQDYLTYVTQVDDYIMTEYMSTAGKRYGLLLDRYFKPVANFPGLCDVWNGKVYFDYGSGDIRWEELYSQDELTSLGERALSEK